MYHLKKNMSKGPTFGLYTFFVPMILGTLTSVWLLGYSWLTSILLASMYASHTLIAYPIVSRLGLNKSPAVIITIAGTIVTVLGALIVLRRNRRHLGGRLIQSPRTPRPIGTPRHILPGYRLPLPEAHTLVLQRYSEPVTQFIYVLAMVFLASYSAKAIRTRERARSLLCRTRAQPLHTQHVTADEPHRVCRQRHIHPLLPHRRRHAHQRPRRGVIMADTLRGGGDVGNRHDMQMACGMVHPAHLPYVAHRP